MNERIPLSFLLTQNAAEDPPVEPTVPFAAMFGDSVKIVTAVLDRTAVLSEPSDRYSRISVKHDQVLVDPATIEWRTKTSEYDGHRILNDGMKPGSAEAKGAMHLLRQPRKQQGSHWRRARVIAGAEPGAEAREASDERALQNQRDVKAQNERELAAHRQRTTKRIEEEAMSTAPIEESPPAIKVIASPGEKHVKCFTCKTTKSVSAFPPIHRGPNVCNSCIQARVSASTATQTSAAVTPVPAKKERKPRAQRKVKVGRAAGKPRRVKTIPLGKAADLASTAPNGPLNGDELRHTKVLALMRRQDALRADLKRVSEDILELVAAG